MELENMKNHSCNKASLGQDGGGRVQIGDHEERIPLSKSQKPPDPGKFQAKKEASLARNSSSNGCSIPLLFERASPRWWNPQFDSKILEQQYWKSTQHRTTKRFQFGLFYLFVLSVLLAIYFPSMKTKHWPTVLGLSLAMCCLVVFVLFLTTTYMYNKHRFKISLVLAFFLCSLSILASINVSGGNMEITSYNEMNDISPAGVYALYLAITLLLYTVVPLPLYGTVLVGVTYSVLFEVVLCTALPQRAENNSTLAVNMLLHICIHVIGIHTLIITQVRLRDTFMKVGQSLMVKKQLGNEKGLKEKMIHSVMPPKVADWLMREGHTEDVDGLNNGSGGSNSDDQGDGDILSESGSMVRKISSPRSSNQGDIRTIFRPFNMNAMENVSILFADIVGFTKMSSNKTASQLVGLLNDLFGRFDYLCNKCGCEKISTLGDCYYCVSGCPEPKSDHARNCVEMGLAMISAIKDFDEDRHESVNMRVGIHTGTVLCGIVGKRRFKFDVWSNDVTLANRMESTGRPGMVHISEKTYSFLNDEYFVQEGDMIKDMRTFFITGRVNSNFVPLDTRMARRTSSTPATFLLPSITKTDDTGNVITQSLPSLPAKSGTGNNIAANVLASSNGSSGNQNSNNNPETSVPSSQSAKSIIRRLSWKKEKKFTSQMSTSRSDSQTANIPLDQTRTSTIPETDYAMGASTTVTLNNPGGVSVALTETSNNSSATTVSSIKQQQTLSGTKNNSKTRICQSEPPTVIAEDTSDCFPGGSESCFMERKGLLKDLKGRRFSNSDPGFLQSSRVLASATDGRELLNSAGFSIDDSLTCIPTAVSEPSGAGTREPVSSGGGPAGNSSSQDSNAEQATIAQLRLADNAMINCVREDAGPAGHNTYFSKPPLQKLTLCFLDKNVEEDYRRTAWRTTKFPNRDTETRRSIPTTSLNAYLDILVSGLLLLVISLAIFLHYSLTLAWIIFFSFAIIYHLILGLVCFQQLIYASRRRTLMNRLYTWGRGWYVSHVFGIILLSLPILSVLVNFNCLQVESQDHRQFYLQLVFFGIIHYSNLSGLNNWIKSLTAAFMSIVIIILSSSLVCLCGPRVLATSPVVKTNVTTTNSILVDPDPQDEGFLINCNYSHTIFMEMILCLILLVSLIWMLNREFETNYRLSFHCSLLSARDRRRIQNLKNQADWLLHNIIPKHVSDQLKKTMQEYSENHLDVGIIFASLVNFNELYDESYMGGKEYLRVLNELISDFDEILDKPEFKNVDKIKTIGSTFMGAAGINPYIRQENSHQYQHLHELMEFVLELQNSVNDFNQSLIEFDLILRIGFNFGDVTAGVIGTTKLYYDIWGDAVNIASRMESTGVEGRIQVSEKAMKILSEWYNFEKRGSIFVKGKDNMTTYLLTSRK